MWFGTVYVFSIWMWGGGTVLQARNSMFRCSGVVSQCVLCVSSEVAADETRKDRQKTGRQTQGKSTREMGKREKGKLNVAMQ